MKGLFWFALAMAVFAFGLIPVTMSRDKELKANAKRVSGTVTKVDYRDHQKASGAGRDKWWEIHVAFVDPFTSQEITRYYPLDVAESGDPRAEYPVGSTVHGFYEAGSEHVILKDELPEPGSSLKPLLIAGSVAGALAGLFGWLAFKA